MKLRALLISLIAVIMLAGCSSDSNDHETTSNEDNNSEKQDLKVYTTVFPLYSMTKEIAGDTLEVESVYPKNVNMHNYEPSQKDILSYAKGDLFIYTNHELDPVAKKIDETIGNDVEVLEAFDNKNEFIKDEHHHDHGHDHDGDHEHGEHEHDHEGEDHEHDGDHEHGKHDHDHEGEDHDHDADHEHGEHDHEGEDHDHDADHEHGEHDHDHDHHHGEFDPHVWLDPELSIQMAENIKNKLVELNPDEKETYEANYETLKADLEDLSKELDEATKDNSRDTVYISHESIGYLANKYDFEQVGINGLNDDEPSQKELTKMISDIKETKTPYILKEQNVSSRLTDMVAKETDVEFLPFHNLEALTDNDPEDATYQSLMRENIKSLEKALHD